MVHVGFLNRQYTGIFSLKYRWYRYIVDLKTDMDHYYTRWPTVTHVRYKLNETLWIFLQNEGEHRVLGNADTKYDALITHIWALKTAQNDKFAALIVYKVTSVTCVMR